MTPRESASMRTYERNTLNKKLTPEERALYRAAYRNGWREGRVALREKGLRQSCPKGGTHARLKVIVDKFWLGRVTEEEFMREVEDLMARHAVTIQRR